MFRIDNRPVYSATDLVGFLECGHLANLERAAAAGHLDRPNRDDPVLDRLAKRGTSHEQRFLDDLRAAGRTIVEISPPADDLPYLEKLAARRDATLAALHDGPDVIYQAALYDGRRLGYADFLLRVDGASDLGDWHYEVWDTKLARSARATAVLQLCMYSEMLARIQGRDPERMHLALGGVAREKVSFPVDHYSAYYRAVARDFERLLEQPEAPLATDPAPVEHCSVCRWERRCDADWRRADDLALVAGLSARQRTALIESGVGSRSALAALDPTAAPRPGEIGGEALARIREQARIQLEGAARGQVISETIPPRRDREGALEPNVGLAMLPDPSPGDLFFDIEGDPFFESTEIDGIEYLFGVVEPARGGTSAPAFHPFWSIAEDGAITPAAEKRAFEQFIDLVTERLEADPNLHIYHYAAYETTAVKRLAGRHATREEEVDRLLRGHVFVDLFRAVRQGIRASVESYSLKRLEPLYNFRRNVELRDANSSIIEFETWLEIGEGDVDSPVLSEIEGYNRDDCLSTLRLRDWLEEQRRALETELGEPLPRPHEIETEEREDSEAQKAVNELVEQVLAGLPASTDERSPTQQAQWLLAQLLNWHRREDKSAWWRYYHLKNEFTDEERVDESDALGMLSPVDSRPDPTPRARSTIYRFSFPEQDHKFDAGDTAYDPETEDSLTVFKVDNEAHAVELKRGSSQPAPEPTSLIPRNVIGTGPQRESLQSLARFVLEQGIDAPGERRTARDLLMRRPPRIAGHTAGGSLALPGELPGESARRLALALDQSYLAIQGPPGSGKSTAGAEIIVDLVANGKRVGVTAMSHKVIGELLKKTADCARERRLPLRIGQRVNEVESAIDGALHLDSNPKALAAITMDEVDVVGGTSWLWSRQDMAGAVDVLVIDEAGQVSLADAVASARCATNLVLLGDPQQLDQPLQGSHPPGADRSALAHLLGEDRVMPGELGLFLDGTWRLHPEITRFTSRAFYDGRLKSHDGRQVQAVQGSPTLSGSGIRLIPVEHRDNSSSSPEEATRIAAEVDALLDSNPTWADDRGTTLPLGPEHILVITPYNAQVAEISERLPAGIRVGTVDKFQGQQAPIAIYSMATSSPEEAPRGMEFLYSLNRLNVATSRARCLAVIVASPALLDVHCRTPRQMRLANELARFVELAAGQRG